VELEGQTDAMEWLDGVCSACERLANADLKRHEAETKAVKEMAVGQQPGSHLSKARSSFLLFELVCAETVRRQLQRVREQQEQEGKKRAGGNPKALLKRELAKRWKKLKLDAAKPVEGGDSTWGAALYGWVEALAEAEKRRADGVFTESGLLS
jgi:hypothetical protein